MTDKIFEIFETAIEKNSQAQQKNINRFFLEMLKELVHKNKELEKQIKKAGL